jgi:hypothetical protein
MTAQFNPEVRNLYEEIIKRNVVRNPRDNFDYMPQRYGGGRVREEALCGNDGHYPSISQIENSNFGGAYGRASHPIAVGSGRKCGGVGILKEARVEPFINELDQDYMPVSSAHGSGRAPRLTKAIKDQILREHPELREHVMRGGKVDWGKIWKGVKNTLGFVSKAAPIISSIAPEEYKDTINKTGDISGAISGMGRRKKAGSMSLAADLIGNYATRRRKGGNFKSFMKDFGTGFKTGLKDITGVAAKAAPIGMLLAPEFAPEIGAVGALSGITNKALGGRRKRMTLPKSGHKREVARGDIVSAIMRQRGVSLGEASRIVKQEGLY